MSTKSQSYEVKNVCERVKSYDFTTANKVARKFEV